ncbi:MAG: tRNA-modifying protein YgfZ [SAR116 cluster bacterium MED-G04]|nr:MAG: tRNA-modifying protein YgfZ [SAR116 cluster bacterium MED-G04]
MSEAVFHALTGRALIRLDGDETADFLQDLITASVTDLAPGSVRQAALLTPQGRILVDLLISHDETGFTLECDRSQRDGLARKLKLYRLRRAIDITIDDRAVHAVEGGCDGILTDPRFPIPVGRLYGDAPAEPTADTDQWRRLRWHHGIAEGEAELPPEKALPLECRLDLDDGISFEKGCYIGQEVTARTRYRGLVKRSYAPVRIDGAITAPATIKVDGRDAGTVFAALPDGDGMLGLASIRLEYLHDDDASLMADDTRLEPFLPERLLPLPGGKD